MSTNYQVVMNKYLSLVFLFCTVAGTAQPLRDINYEYLYNPDAAVRLDLKPVRGDSVYTILYDLHVLDTAGLMNQYSLQWEARNLLSDKEGNAISLNELVISRHASGFQGRGTIAMAGAPRYLVGKVINNVSRRAWLFFTPLQPNYPVNNYLLRNGFVVTDPFVHTNESAKLGLGPGEWFVSYYEDDFPAAAPAFSEAQARVSARMVVDSVFKLPASSEASFARKGLYLVQKDTNAVEGLAFRSEEDYPQYTRLASLVDPLIYITTRQEHERLKSTQGNKKAFDRIILNIVSDTDRARKLMRNYFRRVELANRYFTSYKEGWKTDRGMVYIVFGVPDQVYRFENREVWSYKNNQFSINLTFSKSSSLFDPDNFVLIREKKYEDTWYEVIDLWRNARF